jgi:hypothetical protein
LEEKRGLDKHDDEVIARRREEEQLVCVYVSCEHGRARPWDRCLLLVACTYLEKG